MYCSLLFGTTLPCMRRRNDLKARRMAFNTNKLMCKTLSWEAQWPQNIRWLRCTLSPQCFMHLKFPMVKRDWTGHLWEHLIWLTTMSTKSACLETFWTTFENCPDLACRFELPSAVLRCPHSETFRWNHISRCHETQRKLLSEFGISNKTPDPSDVLKPPW